MKGTRLIIMVLSVLLLTLSSGLLFYKNIFTLGSTTASSKIDFEELRIVDLQINATAASMRKNLSLDNTRLEEETNHLKELMYIVSDVNADSKEIAASMNKVEAYFKNKIDSLSKYQHSLLELKNSVSAINGTYNELNRNNLKFVVDKKDFYRECVVDTLLYVTMPARLYEDKLRENEKILDQIVNFSSAPNPIITKFKKQIETIHKTTNELEVQSAHFSHDSSIGKELQIVSKYFKDAKEEHERDGQIFLTMVFVAIVLYLSAVFYILKKLT